ncbi:hypothetical protein ENUP19_0380G0043 [Entamoeba nuttalli]|uniref:Uncharacterized protein n=2 Tax=Entamoeba nuttalli TaxID=412467 RepID=K2HB47_ENTNP|nr:hypothetical protein ENU1_111180 [Entamoeba nuttalli P19]EKE39899.1 hypothetical protein ENU1_111180 [Entamoeba nuttalli P19]|eukprot:XP_008857766.1 hypothetical protein ENU1_111180 [Entamoeba nuttalli P19]
MEKIVRHKPTSSLKELKRCSKSFEAIQQAFILSLLNNEGVGFKVKKPERRSQKTLQLFLIETLTLPSGEIIEYENDVNNYCNSFVVEELKESGYTHLVPSDINSIASITKVAKNGVSMERLKQIKRHRNANKMSVSFNWILDRCLSYGYEFKKRSTKPTKYTTKMNKICGVSGKISLKLLQITEIGKRVNEEVYKRFDKNTTSVEIKGKDETLIEIIKEVSEQGEKTSVVTEVIDSLKEENEIKVKEEPKENKNVINEITPMDIKTYFTQRTEIKNEPEPSLSTEIHFLPKNIDYQIIFCDTGFTQQNWKSNDSSIDENFCSSFA